MAPREHKMREIHLRWFSHVQRRATDATVRKNDNLQVIGTSRKRKRSLEHLDSKVEMTLMRLN